MGYAPFAYSERLMTVVSRDKAWEAFKDYAVMGKLLVAIHSLYEDGWAIYIKVEGLESSRFEVKKDVRQGCPLSPWLLSIYVFMDSMVTEAMKHFYASVRLTRGLLFANDVMTMAESEKALQQYLQRLNDTLEKWRVKANWQED